jgi:hypothetical protein
MSRRHNIDLEQKMQVINHLINYAQGRNYSNKLIEELRKITNQGNVQCTNNLEQLHRELKGLPKDLSVRFQLILSMVNAEGLINQLNYYTEDLKVALDERVLDSQYRDMVWRRIIDLCNFVKNNIISYIQSQLQQYPSLLRNFNNALSQVSNLWFQACLGGKLQQLFQQYIDCIQQHYVQNLNKFGYDENLLEFVQNHTGIPVSIIQHKPITRITVEFEDGGHEAVEIIELLYSLLPFTLYRRDNEYYIFMPRGEDIEEFSLLDTAGMIIPRKIKLRRISSNPISLPWRNRSIVFMINKDAVNPGNQQRPFFYACSLGFVPITMKNRCDNKGCPRRSYCYDSESNTFKYLIRIDDSYMRVYNISLSANKDVRSAQSNPIFIIPAIINGNVIRGVEMSIDRVFAILYIDRIVFTPRERYQALFIREPELPIRIRIKNRLYKLGLELHDSKAFVIRFNTEFIKWIVKDVLKNNVHVRNYVCLKYLASQSKEEFIYDKVLNAADELLNGKSCDLNDDGFNNFGVKVFAHTLAHALLTLMSAKLQVEPSRVLDYYYRITEDYVEVYVYELGDGGLGLIERETLGGVFPNLDLFNEVLRYVENIHSRCEKKLSEQVRYGNLYVNNYISNDALRNLWNRYVWNAYNNHKIIINAQTLRVRVWDLVKKQTVNSDDAQDFLMNVPVCMDACNYCVMLERGCSEPINQLITTSRSLLYHVLKELGNLISNSQSTMNNVLSKPSRDRLDLFLKLLGSASRSIKVMTYVIDDYMADKLVELKSKNPNLNIRVIVDRKKIGENMDIKNKLINNGIEVRELDNLHAKVYIIDDALVLEGSMNLTMKGLTENTENIELKTNPTEVKQFVENFEKAWESASQ